MPCGGRFHREPIGRIRIEAASVVHGVVIVCKIGIPDAVVRPGREDLEVHRQRASLSRE
jgi:hypothetical protein